MTEPSRLDDVDLSAESLEDLHRFQKRLEKEIKLRQLEKARIARKALRETAREHGFALNELVGSGSRSESRRPVVRFRHPEDRGKTWGGRGRKPEWVREWEAQGGRLDDLRVDR